MKSFTGALNVPGFLIQQSCLAQSHLIATSIDVVGEPHESSLF